MSSGKEALLLLKKRIKKITDRTETVREEKKKKRIAKKWQPSFELESEEKPKRKSRKKKVKKGKNSTDVYAWFSRDLKAEYGDDFVVSRWTVPQKKLAKDLVEIYGSDLVEKAVKYFIENWDDFVASSRGRLRGTPGINLLWGMRDAVFGEVQTIGKGKKAKPGSGKNSDEFVGKDPHKLFGW